MSIQSAAANAAQVFSRLAKTLADTAAPLTQGPVDPGVPAPAAPPAEQLTSMDFIITFGSLALALTIAFACGVFRRGSVIGRRRVPPGRPLWPLAVVLMLGVGVWLGAQVAYGIYLHERHAQEQALIVPAESGQQVQADSFDLSDLTAGDFAILATIPGIIGLIVLAFGDRMLGGRFGADLGVARQRIWPGILRGIIGFVITMPIVMAVTIAAELVYEALHISHPSEHELLHALGESGQEVVSIVIIFGATVVAPLFEELMMRGHLQTILSSLFTRRKRVAPLEPPQEQQLPAAAESQAALPLPADAAQVAPVQTQAIAAPPLSVPQAMPSVPPPLPLPYARPMRAVAEAVNEPWRFWLAILLTSLVFASIHPAWTIPPIFALSVCLGYAYERTGNLWVPITMHLLFNSMQTVTFLAMRG